MFTFRRLYSRDLFSSPILQHESPVEVLELLVDVVATLGELVATVTEPCRSEWPRLYPESLHAELWKFTWSLRDTLDHGNVTSLGRAMVALEVTPGATRADVRAVASAWRDLVNTLRKSWDRLVEEATKLHRILEDETIDACTMHHPLAQRSVYSTTTIPLSSLLDETADCRRAEDSLVSTAQEQLVALGSPMATEAKEGAVMGTSQARPSTERRQRVKEARKLLGHLVFACHTAKVFPMELQGWACYIKLPLRETNEMFPEALAMAEQLWEASTLLSSRHLLVTLGDIHHLLSSPYGCSGGPFGPGGRSVAKRCQEAIEDLRRLCKELRAAPSCGETSNGSSVTGTPEQPERTWGKPEPEAACETPSHLPSDPDLLPPGTRRVLTTSKLIRFFKKHCYECIPTGVIGASQQRQDFVIIGMDSNETLGLSVLPDVVSVNRNEELVILALAYKAPVVIEPKTPIAVAIALPMNLNNRAGYREKPFESFNPHVRWIKHITNERPELTCSLTHLGKTVHIKGTLDTGADITIISYAFWPSDWNLVTPECILTGIGGATRCMQSESMITVTGPEGKTATTRPLVMKKAITLWGRDVMSQWRAKMEVDS